MKSLAERIDERYGSLPEDWVLNEETMSVFLDILNPLYKFKEEEAVESEAGTYKFLQDICDEIKKNKDLQTSEVLNNLWMMLQAWNQSKRWSVTYDDDDEEFGISQWDISLYEWDEISEILWPYKQHVYSKTSSGWMGYQFIDEEGEKELSKLTNTQVAKETYKLLMKAWDEVKEV